MKVIAFFILALLGTSYASQALMKSLENAYKDPTGAALISMISLNLRMGAPIEEIGSLLDKIRDDTLAESQNFEAQTAAENDRLSNAIANGQALDATYQSAIESLQGTIENAQSSLATDRNSLANNEDALVAERQGIQDRDAAAAVDIPQFDQDISDLANAQAACQEAVQKMRTFKQSSEGSATFIQMGTSIKDKIKKATDTMHAMRKKLSKHSNMFTPLIRELIDLSSTLDQSKADKVIDLLTQLISLLADAQSQTENQRATYVTDYQNAQEQATEKVANYEATIDALQQAIQGLVDKIAQAQADLEATQQNLADNAAKLSADQASLEALQSDYAVRRPRYDHLISLVRKIIDFYQNNLTTLDDYVKDTVNHSL